MTGDAMDFDAARTAVRQHLAELYAVERESPTALPYGFDVGDSWAPMIEWDGVIGTYAYLVDKGTGELTPLSFPEFADLPDMAQVGEWPAEDARPVEALSAYLGASLLDVLARTYKRDRDGRFGSGDGDSVESRAAEKLNAGELLAGDPDMDDADLETEERIADAINVWAAGGEDLGRLKTEMRSESQRPGQDTPGALLYRTVAAAPPNGPTLYRGMKHVDQSAVPRVGDTLDLGPASFSASAEHGDRYTVHEAPDYGAPTSMRITLKAGSKSLNIDEQAATEHSGEREHIGMGQYRVTSSTSSLVTIITHDGTPRDITMYDVTMEQV